MFAHGGTVGDLKNGRYMIREKMTNLERLLEQSKNIRDAASFVDLSDEDLDQLHRNTEIKDQMIAVMFEALKKINCDSWERIPCPDRKPGCLTLHWGPSNIANQTAKTLAEIEQLAAQALGEK